MSGWILIIGLIFVGTFQIVQCQLCPSPWFGFSAASKCYRYSSKDKMTWQDARDFCKIHGGDLVKIDTIQERNWIFRTLAGIRNRTHVPPTNWWVGLNNREYLTKWEWADGSQALRNVIVWARGAPNNAHGTERCGEINGNKFNDEDCSDLNKFVCSRDRGIPLTCDADHGWQTSNGACFKYFGSKRNWNSANRLCNHNGGDLVTIDNQNDEIVMHDIAVNNHQPIWIGLYSQKTSATQASWMWTNGTQLTTSYWHGTPHVDRAHLNTSCATVSNGATWDTAWSPTHCSSTKAFVCRKPEGVCLPGWIGHRAYCYQFNAQYRLGFAASTRYCQSQGSELVSIKSQSDEAFIISYITEMKDSGDNSFWIGASDNNNNAGPYKWRNGQAVTTYKHWAARNNHPVNTHNKQDCAFIATSDQSGKWRTTSSCQAHRAFVCKIPMGTSVKAIPSTPVPHFGCPVNWKLHAGICYFVGDRGMDWTSSQTFCTQTSGANLAKIDSANIQSFVNGILKAGQQYWIGLNDRGAEGAYVWASDNSQLSPSYKTWANHQPDNGGHTENCVTIVNNHWNDARCNLRKFPLCSKVANSIFPITPPTTPQVDWTVKCGTGWESNPITDYCYMFVDEPLSWLDALNQCHQYHGNLVSIETLQEQSYLAGRISSMNSIAVWTGANDKSTEGGWKWSSGKPFAFLNWASGQPSNSGQGTDCVTMFTANAEWDDVDCNTRNSYICEKRGNVPRTTTPKPVTVHVPAGMVLGCRTHWKPFSGTCYLFVHQARTWSDAQTTCGRNGGKLASVMNRNEQNFIMGNLPKAAAPVDGYWIGLNDQQTESTFQWADGFSVAYTNWNVNEPNSWMNHNEDCVVMKLNNGKWNDDVCTSKTKGFICKAPTSAVSATQSPNQIGCPQNSKGYGPYCYRVFSGATRNFNAAIATCNRTVHGTLATVNDRFLEAFLSSQLVYRTGYFWIGLSDSVTPGTYTWLTGDSLQYTNWYNTHTGNERSTCVGMRSNQQPTGLWENQNCTKANNYICQFPRQGFTLPPPTATPYPNVPCPSGWVANQGFCYQAFTNNTGKKTWMEALAYCQGLGGDLPSFHNNNNDTFMTTLLAKYPNTAFWIGMNDRDTEAGYVWTDGTAVDYTNWNPNEPNNFLGTEDCVEYNTRSHGWNDNFCYNSISFVCALPRGTVLNGVSVPPTPIASAKCGSDPNWMFYNNSCYMLTPVSGNNASMSWYDAGSYCNSYNANLISIHSMDENMFITGIISKRSFTNYWTGFNELGMDGYQWTDGSPVNFDNWSPGEPNNYFGSERCVDLVFRGFWNDAQCGSKFPAICKRPASGVVAMVTPTPYPPGGCANGFTKVPGGRNKCFYLGGLNANAHLNWTSALAACRRFGKVDGIASVEDVYEQEFLLTMLSGHTNSFWIGLADQYASNEYFWQSNAPVLYTNWDRGQPSSVHAHANTPRTRKGVVMRMSKGHEGRWADVALSQNSAYSYICQATQDPNLPILSPPNSCPSGYVPYRQACYKMSSSQKSWTDAQADCKTGGGNLASITDLYESAFVATQAVDDNSFPYWIGLSDARIHGLYGWSDGWPVQFTNWGWKEPSYGQAQGDNGCVLANRNGKWNDTNCSRKLHYACKLTSVTPPPTTALPPGSCADPTWIPNGDFCYYISVNQGRSWPEAGYLCNKLGMQIASIHSKPEMDFVFNLVLQAKVTNQHYKPNVWIGLSKGSTGTYTWSDNSPANFFYWTPGEPTILGQHGEMQECIEFDRKLGTWNDVNCFTNRGLVCKTTKVSPSTPPAVIVPGQVTPKPGSDLLPTYVVVTESPGVRPGQGNTALPPGITFPSGQITGAALPGQQSKQSQKLIADTSTGMGLSSGGIAGVVLGCVAILVIIAFALLYLKRSGTIKPPPINQSGDQNGSLGFDNALYDRQNDSIKLESNA